MFNPRINMPWKFDLSEDWLFYRATGASRRGLAGRLSTTKHTKTCCIRPSLVNL